MTAIAQPVAVLNQLPTNYMIWRGQVYNLDYMAGKGVAIVAQPPQTTASSTTSTAPYIPSDAQVAKDRAVRDQKNSDAFAAARRSALLEYLQR
jgi:hypothetical protein